MDVAGDPDSWWASLPMHRRLEIWRWLTQGGAYPRRTTPPAPGQLTLDVPEEPST